MSLNVFQATVKNADENPELYSPTFSIIEGSDPTETRLTLEVKKNSDVSRSAQLTKREDEKSSRYQRLHRGRANVVRWLDTIPYSDTVPYGEIIPPRHPKPARVGTLRSSKVKHSVISTRIGNMPIPNTDLSEGRKLPKQTNPIISQLAQRELSATERLRQGSDSTSSTLRSSVLSNPLDRDSASSLEQGCQEGDQPPRSEMPHRNANSPRGSTQENSECYWRTQEDIGRERAAEARFEGERLRRQRQSTLIYQPLILPMPSTEAEQRPSASAEKDKDEDRYKKPWSPPDPALHRYPETTWGNPPLENTLEVEEPKSAEIQVGVPDDEDTPETSPEESPNLSPEMETEFFVPSTLAPTIHGGSTLPPKLLAGEFPTEDEARWLYFGMRNQRAQERAEGRDVPDELFPLERELLPKIMKTPSKKFRDTFDAQRQAYFAQRRLNPAPPPTRPAQAPEQLDDVHSETDSNASAVQEEEGDQVHGIINDPDGPGWLRNWLIGKEYAKPADLHLHSYKGYNIEAPKLQLIRAKNFLSAHDRGNLHDWEQNFDELCQYTKYLWDNYKDEDWGFDLFEVISMLQTHNIWEKYVYTRPKLDLDINDGKGRIYRGPHRFPYDRDSVVYYTKNYQPPGAPRREHERGSLAGKTPGFFIQPHCVDSPPKNAHIDPFAYTKGAAWFDEHEKKCVESTKGHALKEAWGHKYKSKRKATIMPLPPVANWNGPIVDIIMDKDMKKLFETIKKYEQLVAKLRQTIWKTAVYGKREVLAQCLVGVERGLEGETWSFLGARPGVARPPGITPAIEAEELRPIRPAEVEWLHFLTTTAPLKAPTGQTKEAAIFLERLQSLLANPRGDGIFARYARPGPRFDPSETPLDDLTEAINFGLKNNDAQKGPKTIYIFSEDEVWEYAGVAEELGMVHRVETEEGGDVFRGIGELSIRGLLPEQRICWADVGTSKTSTQTNGVAAAREDGEEEEEEDNDDSLSVVSSTSAVVSIPSSEPDFGDYTRFFPKFSSLRPWTPDSDESRAITTDQSKTIKFYQRLGNHLGYTLQNLRKELKETEASVVNNSQSDTPEKDRVILKNQSFLRSTLDFWADDYHKRTRNKDKSHAAHGERQVPLFKDIVEIADPESQGRVWSSKDRWEDKEEHEAREKVRQGLIREVHENKSNIWPARPGNFSADEAGNKFPAWRQDSLWSFGKPETRGFTIKKLFSINRWPRHLQSEKTQKALDKHPAYPQELRAQAEKQKKWDEEVAQQVPYSPARFLGANDREILMEGNEYWFGATPKQQRQIWKNTHLQGEDDSTGTSWREKISSIFPGKRKRDEIDEIDEFEAGSLRLPSPTHFPTVRKAGYVAERRAKKARLSG